MKRKKSDKRIPTKTKAIALPLDVLELLEADAKRCKRTLPMQIIAILEAYVQPINKPDILDAEVIG